MPRIREYKEGGKAGIIRLVREVLFEVSKAEASKSGDLGSIKRGYLGKGCAFYFAEDGGVIVGTAGVRKEGDNVARLRRMFVDRTCRNKRVGKALPGRFRLRRLGPDYHLERESKKI